MSVQQLGKFKNSLENTSLLEQFINRMNKLIENRSQQGKLLKELVESTRYNILEFCEPDKIHVLGKDLDNLIKGIK